MKKVKLFLACLLAVASTALYAQNITVKGTVTDQANGEPVTGAAVVCEGGGDPVVRERIVQTVSALFSLKSNHISVMPM